MAGRGRALAALLDPAARRIARSGSLEDALRASVTRGFASGGDDGAKPDVEDPPPPPPERLPQGGKEPPKPGMGRGGGVAGGELGSLTNQILSRPQRGGPGGRGRGGRGGGGRGRGRGRGGGGFEGRDRSEQSPTRAPLRAPQDRARKFDPAYAAFAAAGSARRPSRFQQRQNVMEENDGVARLQVDKSGASERGRQAPSNSSVVGDDYEVLRRVHHYMEMELDPQWMSHMAVGSLPNMEPGAAAAAPEAVLDENKAAMMSLLGVETETEWKELTGQVLQDFAAWEEAEGRKRVAAGGTREGLSMFEERAALQGLPEVEGLSTDPEVGGFVQRAASALEKNPRWTFDQKKRFLKLLPRGLQ